MPHDQLTLDVSFIPSSGDWIRSQREYQRSTRLTIRALIAALWVGFLVDALIDDDMVKVVAIVTVSILLMAVLAGATAVSRRRYLKRNPFPNEEIEIHF